MQDFTDALRHLSGERDEAAEYLRVEKLRRRLPQLEVELGRPDLWDDADQAQAIQREFAEATDDIELFDRLDAALEDLSTLHELAREEGDESLEAEIAEGIESLTEKFDKLELRALFTGEYDEGDAIVELNSGAGGVDAQDWTEMLLRMYQRWAERHDFSLELQEVSEGTEAGLSSATFLLKGRNAYGWFHSEHGVHRLVRISPFDNNARRQTSFASVRVTPFLEDVDKEMNIDDKDLRIDVYRSSGAGGQHVNTTDSAVRITHVPSGTVVAVQNERSQFQNKDKAMALLKSKLLELERRKRLAEIDAISGDGAAVDFGSQDRNYVLQPYQQVKDLRSGKESSNPEAVLDGDLDAFMEAWLRWNRTANTGAAAS